MNAAMLNAMSVDVEEYYHALIFQECARGVDRSRLESRVEASVDRVLRLFAAHDVRATFFVLGEVARAHPALVRRIAGGGHEIASHGDRHQLVSRQSAEEFRADIVRAKTALEKVTGQAVLGYRAPNFSIGAGQAWAYDVLLSAGFKYDSSSYPILHDRYGDHRGERFPHTIQTPGRRALREFPVGTVRTAGVNLPIGGGGYFRLLQPWFFEWGIHRVNKRERQPVMFYFHPWELDPEQPRAQMRWRHSVRHYVGLRRQEAKLARLLAHVRFGTAREILGIDPGE